MSEDVWCHNCIHYEYVMGGGKTMCSVMMRTVFNYTEAPDCTYYKRKTEDD